MRVAVSRAAASQARTACASRAPVAARSTTSVSRVSAPVTATWDRRFSANSGTGDSPTGLKSKAASLRGMLESSDLEFIMEAHNGLSAKIVEEAGFKGIWGSGLSISASLGVRDNNEASYTQVLDVCEYMSDNTDVPILLDGDTGFGNFNNARRLVRKLEQRGVAGVCIEDKLFPKTNSLLGGKQDNQPLADIEEFSLKLRAMKDTQTDPNFVVVARVEAFISNWPLEEALRRSEAYRQAGADAILMHSKKGDCSEIEAFMKAWGDRLPVIIVPTKYYKTPTDEFRDMGVSMVIWANHNMRAAVTAMQETTKQIFEDQHLMNVEGKIASVPEVFRLQGNDELVSAEDKYLPKK
jgi:phosphoenolpyruvate phosphomutase